MKRWMFKRLAPLGLCAALSFGLLTGCQTQSSDDAKKVLEDLGGSSLAQQTQTTSDHKTLQFATEIFSATLDPTVGWDSWYVVRYGVGETLTRFNEKGDVEPWLAESWSVSDDHQTWTFKLKDHVTFSNGEAMTASKVKASIEHLYDVNDPAKGGSGNPQAHFTYVGIEADDAAKTVAITTTEPKADLPGAMAYPWMLVMDVEGLKDRDVTNEGPIGTGPYMIKSFVKDTSVDVVKNPHYWNGEVPFEQVHIAHVADSATRSLALQDGSVDFALNISPADQQVLAKKGGFHVVNVPGTRAGYAHINVSGVLKNKTLRQAILMAIHGEAIAEKVTNQAYTYGFSVIPKNLSFGYDQLKNPYAYDPDAAKKLLDDNKIIDTDGDGYRELEGKNIDLHYVVTANRQMDKIVQAQASQLKEIGIKCTVDVVETQTEQLNSHQFDLCSANEVTAPTGDPSKFLKHWYSSSDNNYALYQNPDFDAVYDQLNQAFDQNERVQLITKLQQMLIDDAAVLPYGCFNFNLSTTDQLEGTRPTPNDFYWITETLRFKR